MTTLYIATAVQGDCETATIAEYTFVDAVSGCLDMIADCQWIDPACARIKVIREDSEGADTFVISEVSMTVRDARALYL